jgi:hypothetical protein
MEVPGMDKPGDEGQRSKGVWREVLRLDPVLLPAKPLATSLTGKRQTNSSKLAPYFSKPALFQHRDVEFRSNLSHRGGQRGFYATEDIEAGELLLAEIPAAEIPDDPPERDPSERCVLHLVSGKVPLEEAQRVLGDFAHLHPRRIEDIDRERYEGLRSDYEPFLEELKKNDRAVKLGLTEEATLLRVLCALHFNGFSTGVYLHLAMANHSCAANSVKWGARDSLRHSEVRALRHISKGEEITFSYLVPIMRSREARQRALQGQFGFTCTCELCQLEPETSDLERGPPEAVLGLELLLEHVEKANMLYVDPLKTFRLCSKARNEARMKGVHPRHLCLAHADMVTIDACLALLDEAGPERKPRLDDGLLVLTLLTRSVSLRSTQLLMFKVGAEEGGAEKETRSDAEVTLQHVMNSLGFYRARGKAGEKTILNLKDDDNRPMFVNVKEADECQRACDAACRAIADLHLEHDDELYGNTEATKVLSDKGPM